MKAMYLALILALGGHSAQAMEAEKSQITSLSPLEVMAEVINVEDPFASLSTIEGWNELNQKKDPDEAAIYGIAYKLNTKFGLKVSRQILRETEAFEQFIIDHALSLTMNHPYLAPINVSGKAQWFPCDTFCNDILVISYPTLSDSQRQSLCGIYNSVYESGLAAPATMLYPNGGYVGYNIGTSLTFNKPKLFKHVFSCQKVEKKEDLLNDPYAWQVVEKKGYNIPYTLDAIAYYLKAQYGLEVTSEQLKTTQIFAQFVINHALGLLKNRDRSKDTDKIHIPENHRRLTKDPLYHQIMTISYPQLTPEQQKAIEQTYDDIDTILKTQYGETITTAQLRENQVLEQAVINHTFNIQDNAQWLACDPFYPHMMIISCPTLTTEQFKTIAQTYNVTYELMAVRITYSNYLTGKGGPIPGFDMKNAIAFRKDLFFKHVFKAGTQK